MSKAVLGMEGSGWDGRRVTILGNGPGPEPPEPAWAPEAGGLRDQAPHPAQEENCSPVPSYFS